MTLFREFNRFDFGALRVTGLSLALGALALPATAQHTQDNRQLQRDPTQQTSQTSQRRIALVIGNGAYTNAPPLKNPPTDARDMAATLRALGWDVTQTES